MAHTEDRSTRVIYTNAIVVLQILKYDWLYKVKQNLMVYWQQEFKIHVPWCALQVNSHFSRGCPIFPWKIRVTMNLPVMLKNLSQIFKQGRYHRQNPSANKTFHAKPWRGNLRIKEKMWERRGQDQLLCLERQQRRICCNGYFTCRNRVYRWDRIL